MSQVYRFEVQVLADSAEDAQRVMMERIDHCEDYGFDYRIDWTFPDEVAG